MIDRSTHGEIVEIKKEIADIKQSQEVDMQRNRDKYLEFISRVLGSRRKRNYAKVFLEVDGLKSRRDIEDYVPIPQRTIHRAIRYLEKKGLIYPLRETRRGSPIYGKPRWVHVLHIDEYVRNSILDE